jgi:integrase/recombinase XerD
VEIVAADFASLMTKFLTNFLPLQRNVSKNTISSYCDTFRLLLTFMCDEKKAAPERFAFQKLTRKFVMEFLKWLEDNRHCSISTRNQRLAAIHSFTRYVQIQNPVYLLQCQEIITIEFKKHETPMIHYLTVDDMQLLLSQPNQNTRLGRRDLTLLCLLYDAGARVQELVDLRVRDIRLLAPCCVKLTGKGRKSREVPILPKTADLLATYLKENYLDTPEKLCYPLFCNRQGNTLTRAGVTYILQKYSDMAASLSPLIPQKITPHILRHSKAMHLLSADVNLAYIRDILGHNDISTTEIYARADLSMKRKALEKAVELAPETAPWTKDANLIDWLKQYGKT